MEHTVTGGRYGLNIGRLIDDYPEFTIMGETPGQPGYIARTRAAPEGQGATLRDLTLDGLAEQMNVCRRRLDGT